jgi:rhodanese-related sulfurtransferase
MIIDLRTEREFMDHHLPGSDRTDYEIIVDGLENSFVPAFRRSGIRPVFVCAYGGKSSVIARRVKALGVDARNLQGGTQEWSRLGFPRIRNAMCPC